MTYDNFYDGRNGQNAEQNVLVSSSSSKVLVSSSPPPRIDSHFDHMWIRVK